MVNVDQGGIYAPGNSPGIVTAAAVNFDHTSVNSGAPVLQIELAGTAPGTQYDQLHVTGQLSLGGTLQVSLLNAFAPAAGNTFDILDWGTLSGTFAALHLPTLTDSLSWNTSQLYTSGVLSVANASIPPGDFNRDGHVNAADLPAMLAALTDLNRYKSANSLTDADLLAIGDIDGSGSVTNADVQALLTLLRIRRRFCGRCARASIDRAAGAGFAGARVRDYQSTRQRTEVRPEAVQMSIVRSLLGWVIDS